MSSRILYGYWRSSAAYRVRLALAVKGLAWEHKGIDLRAGAQHSVGFKIMNPQGFVPFLIDGEVGLNQSLAIIEYLDETYPEPRLLPDDAVARARVRAAAQIIACDIHPLNNLRVLGYLKEPLGQDQNAIDDWYRHWVEQGLAPLEEIAESASGSCLFGEQVTMADLCLVPQMYNARRFRCDLTRFPRLVEIDRALNARADFLSARPERQPDADQ